MTEADEQIALVQWLNLKKILYYHIPNGLRRHILEAKKLKKMGVMPGVPDLCIPIPNKKYHGLYIELKRTGGGLVSPAQLIWIEKLNNNGYMATIANGFDEAAKVVEGYLNDKR
jgi:hypothetical protein